MDQHDESEKMLQVSEAKTGLPNGLFNDFFSKRLLPDSISGCLAELDLLRDMRAELPQSSYRETWDKIWNRIREIDRMWSPEFMSHQMWLANQEKEERDRRKARLGMTEVNCPYKTLKAAYAEDWIDKRPEHYLVEGQRQILLKGHILVRRGQYEVALSESAWRRWHNRRPINQYCHDNISNGWLTYAVYRLDQTEPIPRTK